MSVTCTECQDTGWVHRVEYDPDYVPKWGLNGNIDPTPDTFRFREVIEPCPHPIPQDKDE